MKEAVLKPNQKSKRPKPKQVSTDESSEVEEEAMRAGKIAVKSKSKQPNRKQMDH